MLSRTVRIPLVASFATLAAFIAPAPGVQAQNAGDYARAFVRFRQAFSDAGLALH